MNNLEFEEFKDNIEKLSKSKKMSITTLTNDNCGYRAVIFDNRNTEYTISYSFFSKDIYTYKRRKYDSFKKSMEYVKNEISHGIN